MSDYLTAELNAIQARADAATPGPWWIEDKGLCCPTLERAREVLGHDKRSIHAVMMPHPPFAFGGLCAITFSDEEGVGHSLSNRDFIASARTDIPRLVAALRVACQELQTLVESTDYGSVVDWRTIEAALKGDAK